MTPTEQLLTLSKSYCNLRGISERTASGIIFRDSRTIVRVKEGGSLTVRSFERALNWFRENWPEGSEWPDGVDRHVLPAQSKRAAKEPAHV
ncbi:hypothetical protein [Acetobacter phage phiAX1]|nr:hypothetical protein [Acetobacter phage phiAX1]